MLISRTVAVMRVIPTARSANIGAVGYSFLLNWTAMQLPLQDYYAISGSCPNATHPLATASATPRPWPARQLAATSLLLPLAHEFGIAVSAYMVGAQVDIAAASQVRS